MQKSSHVVSIMIMVQGRNSYFVFTSSCLLLKHMTEVLSEDIKDKNN